jgi:RND family efflux transporter MFP subunit
MPKALPCGWVTLAIALLACRTREAPAPAPDGGGAVRVRTAEAREEVVPRTLASTGTLVGAQEAVLSPLVSGRVTRVHVEIGDRVKKGAPIVELRKDDFRSQTAAAEAALEQARATASGEPESLPEVEAARAAMETARRDLVSDERLFEKGAISEQALEQSRSRAKTTAAQHDAALDAARGAVSAVRGAEAQVEQARRALADATVRAPFAGEIATRGISAGESVTPQTAVARLVQVDVLRVKLAIPQEQVPLVRVGQPVSLRVSARPDRTFAGTVKYVSAAVDPGSRVLDVEAEVPNPEGLLRPGYFVRAEIDLGDEKKMVRVPTSALVDNGESYSVFVIKDGRAEERVVHVEGRDGEAAHVESGIRPGEKVAVDRPGELRDGVAAEH